MRRKLVLCIAALVVALPALATQNQERDIRWRSWLVRIEHAHRRDFLPADARRITALVEKLDAAKTDRERARLERQLERAREQAEAHAGFVLYGWSMLADDQGRSLTKTSSMAGFFIPGGADVERMLADLKPGDCIAIDRRGADELFTFSGRKFIDAKRGVVVACDDALKSQAFPVPPKMPDADALRAVELELNYTRTRPRNEKSWHSYTLKIEADGSVTKREALDLWLEVRFVGPDGAIYGPIIDTFDVPRSSESGNFVVTRGMSIITWPRFPIDAEKTTVELIAAR